MLGQMRHFDVLVQGTSGDGDINGQDVYGKSDCPGWVRLLKWAYAFIAGLQR